MTSEPKKNKKLFFLVAMPRSGNTLFASIVNQNPEIACTANSITLEIMKDLYLLKETDVFQNYPDHKSLDNVLGQLQSIERIKKDIAIENKKKEDAKLEFDKNSIGQQD